jgi:hypothetical protein
LRAFESDTTERNAPLILAMRLAAEVAPEELLLVILAATLDFLWDADEDNGIIVL